MVDSSGIVLMTAVYVFACYINNLHVHVISDCAFLLYDMVGKVMSSIFSMLLKHCSNAYYFLSFRQCMMTSSSVSNIGVSRKSKLKLTAEG